MAITPTWYGQGLLSICNQSLDADGASACRVALLTNSYTPDRDTDNAYDDVSAYEVANGDGYTTGGYTVTASWSYDASSDQVRLDIGDPTWTFTASKTWRYAVLYLYNATPANALLIGLLTWDSDQTVSTAYTLQIDSAGLLYIDTT